MENSTVKFSTSLPLPVNEYIGHDGHRYLDLAVDSTSSCTLTWLRRCLDTGQHCLVVSVPLGHVLRKNLSLVEARDLYLQLPSKLPDKLAFPQGLAVEQAPDCYVHKKKKKNKPQPQPLPCKEKTTTPLLCSVPGPDGQK